MTWVTDVSPTTVTFDENEFQSTESVGSATQNSYRTNNWKLLDNTNDSTEEGLPNDSMRWNEQTKSLLPHDEIYYTPRKESGV